MDTSFLYEAAHALVIIGEPHRLFYLFCGVCAGLALGILPGIGGIAGTALLLPFTYNLDPSSAFALLLGLGASTGIADPISAILFGVPGHAASAATALDGFPMTKRGEGGRALGASYMSALLGGLFGAALLGVALPLVRPLLLHIGSPEMLALSVFGISMVSVLSGNAPLKGLMAACFGIMLAMIGGAPQTGTLRWTMDSLYLWGGLPLVPVTLGVFALPELCDLMISRRTIVAGDTKIDARSGMLQGVRDCFDNWFLILRCSWIGASMGAVPGIGSSVIDWLSYGHALRTEKGASETFGKGDVRGVIAAESATNAKEGGALVPTVVFGVPGSPGMAILLGAFLIQGLVPGPDMVTKHLDITYSMVWSIAIANIVGAGLCFLFSGQLAKLATLRYTLIMPVVLSLVYIGAFEGSRQWGDLYSLLFFGLVGWAMKHSKIPRPPLVLGFILGGILERYLFISTQRYGLSWLEHPVVILFLGMALFSILRPFISDLRKKRKVHGMSLSFAPPKVRGRQVFPALLLGLFGVMMWQAQGWDWQAKIVPVIVCSAALIFGVLSLLADIFGAQPTVASAGEVGGQGKMHMDVVADLAHVSTRAILARAGMFFGWMIGFLGSMALIGLIPTVPIFIIGYMRLEGREKWRIVLPMAIVMTALIYVVFDRLLSIPWPVTVLGTVFPGLAWLPSV
jgi:TctA family transporter